MWLSWLIDAAYAGGLALGSPFLLFRMATSERFRAGFAQRLGFVGGLSDGASVWIHGASVGETMLSARLARTIEKEIPGQTAAVSVNTLTGYGVASSRLDAGRTFYCPIDFHFIVNRVLRKLRPKCLVMVELEFWPNLWLAAAEAGIPVVLVNGRMTEKGRKRLGFLGPLCSKVFAQGVRNVYCVQNQTYAERLLSLGVPADRVRVTGNMKFDTVEVAGDEARNETAQLLGLRVGDFVFTCGSTYAGEEEALIDAFRNASSGRQNLRLVLAPRQPSRGDEVERTVLASGFKCARRSKGEVAEPGEVYILDTVGELARFYAIADLVYVGGSLIPHGGHNLVEPAAAGKPLLFGPHMGNFVEEVAILRECGGGRMISSAEELSHAVTELVNSPALRRGMAQASLDAVERNRGATRLSLEAIREALKVAPVSDS